MHISSCKTVPNFDMHAGVWKLTFCMPPIRPTVDQHPLGEFSMEMKSGSLNRSTNRIQVWAWYCSIACRICECCCWVKLPEITNGTIPPGHMLDWVARPFRPTGLSISMSPSTYDPVSSGFWLPGSHFSNLLPVERDWIKLYFIHYGETSWKTFTNSKIRFSK